jgi:hypothetical protein
MPRYFFHISCSDPFEDEEGMDLPDDATAWLEAKKLVRDIEGSLAPGEEWRLQVADRAGSVFVISLKSERMR